MIFVLTLFPTLACLAVVFLVKSTYQAESIIKPPTEGGSSIGDVLKESGGGGGGGGFLGSLLGGSESGQDELISLLKSASFANVVIDRFDLETLYKFKKEGKPRKYYHADVIKHFQTHAKYELTDENAIKISMTDESPDRAKEMVAFMIHALDSLYTDIQRTATQRRLEYVDHRLVMAETEMKNMEDSLVAFQNRNNLIVPEVQVKLILENATQTEIQIETLKEQMALEESLRGRSSARYRDMNVQKDLLQGTLRNQLRSPADSNTLILPARALPALATEYFRRERAYNVRLAVYKYLVQQVEALKLEANKNVQVISVLDPPWANDKRVSPKRRVMVETVFILSFILASVIAVLLTAWGREENLESRKLVSDIKKSLSKF